MISSLCFGCCEGSCFVEDVMILFVTLCVQYHLALTIVFYALVVFEDGRLCAAAFVQNRRSYTGCTDAPNPVGGSGRAWCYVEAQLLLFHGLARCICFDLFLLCELLASDALAPSWDFCAPTVDYDIMRKEASAIFDAKVNEVQSMVSKLLQTQRAAEQTLDKYILYYASRARVDKNALNGHRYEKTCTA